MDDGSTNLRGALRDPVPATAAVAPLDDVASAGTPVFRIVWGARGGGAVPGPPAWVFGPGDAGPTGSGDVDDVPGDGSIGRLPSLPGTVLLGARVPDAAGLDREALRTAVSRLYGRIRRALQESGAPHAVRMWQFVPAIHDTMGPGVSRYMVFNEGRYDGFADWYRGCSNGGPPPPASTGVGHHMPDLLAYCLGAARPGISIENPRQRPAYRYSRTYGPRPPCFARATTARIGRTEMFLVSGTASVRGEDSTHPGALEGQIDETFRNLEALVATWIPGGVDPSEAAGLFRHMRAYHANDRHAPVIRSAVLRNFPGLRALEMVRADICREELLVEIEGLACRGSYVPGAQGPPPPYGPG